MASIEQLEEEAPPPLDDVSSAGGTEGECDDPDLEVNLMNSSYPGIKYHKPFNPVVSYLPTDVIYREENSRAAPRKGIEPKAFLTIGETREERLEYVGRTSVTAPSRTHASSQRQIITASTKKIRNQTPPSSAPLFRHKSASSRASSGIRGRPSIWSSPGYTPLPVAPPQAPPTRENTYLHHPFKQDVTHDATKQETLASRHRFSSIEELLAGLAYYNIPLTEALFSSLRRPVSPGEEMKQSTIFATMEVGRLINHRERTPNGVAPRKPKLLKARLKPLNTVNVSGPSIYKCQGIQPERQRFGPSQMKSKQRKQLDDVIQKNAALKDIKGEQIAQRNDSSKSRASSRESMKKPTTTLKENPEDRRDIRSASSSGNGPTPSPYASQTKLDMLEQDDTGFDSFAHQDEEQLIVQDKAAGRIKSAYDSEGSGSQVPDMPDRSVSAVTIKSNTENVAIHVDRLADNMGYRGETFITDADSSHQSRSSTAKKSKQAQRSGCRDFKDTPLSKDEPDEDDQFNGDRNGKTVRQNQGNTPHNGSGTHTKLDCNTTNGVDTTHKKKTSTFNHIIWETDLDIPSQKSASKGLSSQQGQGLSKHNDINDCSTFVTAGFLTLDSMIQDARNTLRHSYSLSDLEEAEWDNSLTSPRSLEVLPKVVRFADDHVDRISDSGLGSTHESGSTRASCSNLELITNFEVNQASVVVGEYDSNKTLVNIDQNEISGKDGDMDQVYKELAARDTELGICGAISEHLISNILPSTHTANPKQHVELQSPAIGALPKTEHDLDPFHFSALVPSLNHSDEANKTPETGSPGYNKSFLECFVDLLPEINKNSSEDQRQVNCNVVGQLSEVIQISKKHMETRSESPRHEHSLAASPPMCFKITHRAPEGCVFYFTYDADTNIKRLSSLLDRDIHDKRWGVLFGFQLVFNKQGMDASAGLFPNIDYNPYSSTEGAVYCVTFDELTLIDASHGYPDHYARMLLPVWVVNSFNPDEYNIAQYCVPAITYIAQDKWLYKQCNEPAADASHAIQLCLKGAGLTTTHYRNYLTTLLERCT